MNNCPHCGQQIHEAPAPIKVDLDRNVVSVRGTHAAFSRRHTELLYALSKDAPRVMTHEALNSAMFGKSKPQDKANLLLNKLVCALKKRISEVSLPIVITNVHGVGWWLDIKDTSI